MDSDSRVRPASRKTWRQWLQKHSATSSGVWVVFAKKHTGIPTLTYDDAVEEALCFGWIDSVRHPVDGTFYKQWFSRRKPRSLWSKPNKGRVARLIDAGLMTAAGLAVIDLAKRTGAWDAHDHVEALAPPPELQEAIEANARARANWDALPATRKKHFLYWLSNVKREETRSARIKEIVAMVARKETLAQRLAPDARRRAPADRPARARSRRKGR